MRLARSIAGVLAVAVCIIGQPSAAGDCVTAEVRIWYEGNNNPDYLVGPNHCVAPTPWNDSGGTGGDLKVPGVPPGTPHGVGVDIRYTLP